MPVAVPTDDESSKLNTIAVIPLANTSSSSSFLRSAASNLIHAIAQGATIVTAEDKVADEDQGASSFTYTAPAAATRQAVWYTQVPWHISNRYYEADVTLKAYNPDLLSIGQSEQASTSQGPSNALTGIPAYIVIVDRTRPLEEHKRFVEQIEKSVTSDFDAEISIVSGIAAIAPTTGPDSTTQCKGPSISDLVTLYADAGWEFIAVDHDDDDDELDEEDHDEDVDSFGDPPEQDGIERIREALQNYMWNGLTRKHEHQGPVDNMPATTPQFDSIGFSSAQYEDEDEPELSAPLDTEPSQPSRGIENAALPLPSLDLGNDSHASPHDLDEQLAKLFLSSRSNTTDLAELEAFLESEDPSWPSDVRHREANTNSDFEDNFDDFLPFQSAPVPASTTLHVQNNIDDAFPDESEITSMRKDLFGSTTDGHSSSIESQDLSAQLHQLQWHAQRVRDIADPEKRRKEAALVALAFSMQWADDDHKTSSQFTSTELSF